ncbi:hypothetical protein H7X65_01380 [Candidatus Parcubacteria bacterium]|nr:hypothetical protein [Candidatus Parcubacteria bacterium]
MKIAPQKIAILLRANLNDALLILATQLHRSGHTLFANQAISGFLAGYKIPTQPIETYWPLMDDNGTGVKLVVALMDPSMGDEFPQARNVVNYYCDHKVPVIVSEKDFEWFTQQMPHMTKPVMSWMKRRALSRVSLVQLEISIDKDRPGTESRSKKPQGVETIPVPAS